MRLDGASRRIGLILIIPTLMVMLDLTIVTVAIPLLTTDFDASLSTVQWVTTAYTLALVAVMPLSAAMTRRFGARRTYCTALLVFVIASLLVAFSWNIASLIVFRAFQGLGGGMLQPVGMAIALQSVRESQRGRMMALLGLPVLIGPVIGPIVGGVLVDQASWRVVFAINVPLGLVAAWLAARYFPAPAPRDREPVDLLAVAALSPGGAFVVFGLARSGDSGSIAGASILVPIGIGLLLLGYFVWRSLRSAHPILDLTLLTVPALRGGVVVMLFFAGAYFGSMLILPVYVQAVRGDSATMSGALYLVPGLVTGITLQIATRIADRTDPRRVALAGIVTSMTAMALLGLTVDATTPYPLLIAMLALMGVGVGATVMPTITAATRGLEGADTAGGTTILTTGNQFSAALVAAFVTALLAGLMNGRVAVLDGGGVGGAMRLPPASRAPVADDLASSVADTYLATSALLACALLAALTMMPRRARRRREPVTPSAPP
ncbi:MDR family MFS transporter [Gordonia sinesedis]